MNSILHIQAAGEAATILVTEIQHTHHTMYKVIMESGYSNIFYNDVETGRWVEEDLGFTELARQIGKEVRTLKLTRMHIPKILTWHNLSLDSRSFRFGICSFLNGDQKMFEIYHSNRRYMYTLVDEGQQDWHIFDDNNVDIRKVDCQLIEDIIKVLPLYSCPV